MFKTSGTFKTLCNVKNLLLFFEKIVLYRCHKYYILP